MRNKQLVHQKQRASNRHTEGAHVVQVEQQVLRSSFHATFPIGEPEGELDPMLHGGLPNHLSWLHVVQISIR